MFTPNTLPLILVVLLIYLILLIAPTSLYVEAAREKGYYQNKSTAYLYVIAAFFTPFTVGLYVAGLPDRRILPEAPKQNLTDDLPAI